MTWHLGPMAPFDCESGGTNVETDGVVSITVGRVGDGPADMWSGLIAVDFDIDPKAIEVHGITTEYARAHGRPAAEVLDEAAERLAAAHTAGIPTVGSNLAYDYTILDRNCTRYGVKHGGAHDAVEDALAAARVAYKIGARSQLSAATLRQLYSDRRYPDSLVRGWQAFGRLTLAEVHEGQIVWYEEQLRSRGEYWAKERLKCLANADADEPPPLPELPDAGDDERRQVWREQADDYEQRIASLRFEWPIVVAP